LQIGVGILAMAGAVKRTRMHYTGRRGPAARHSFLEIANYVLFASGMPRRALHSTARWCNYKQW